MSNECDDCGREFETLTRLRLHDCSTVESDTFSTDSAVDESAATDSSPAAERDGSVAEIDNLLDRFADGETETIHYAVVEFESALSAALEEDQSGDAYRDVFWPYYERISDTLDEATRANGWTLLDQVIEAYDPTADDRLPLVTPAIANAVGRYIIRTRLTDGVDSIPAAALEYLDAVAVNADESDDIVREEIHVGSCTTQ